MARTQILVHRWGPRTRILARYFADGLNQRLVSSVTKPEGTKKREKRPKRKAQRQITLFRYMHNSSAKTKAESKYCFMSPQNIYCSNTLSGMWDEVVCRRKQRSNRGSDFPKFLDPPRVSSLHFCIKPLKNPL